MDTNEPRRNYAVHIRFQFPTSMERNGFTLVVNARSKAEAIRLARREWSEDGTIDSALGLSWLRATETDDEADI